MRTCIEALAKEESLIALVGEIRKGQKGTIPNGFVPFSKIETKERGVRLILGIGCDLVEISRMKKALEKGSFLTRYFTEKEQAEFLARGMRVETAAGRFAAKEAFSKAVGTGFSGFMPQEVEVLSDSQGAPYLVLYSGALERQKALGIRRMHVSITHERSYAQAFVVLEGEKES